MTDTAKKSLPHYAKYAWKTGGKRRAEPSTKLNTRKVVEGAVELADREGLENLTIRNLSNHLGVSAMAIYRHISSRDELLVLMMDACLGEPPGAIRTASDWQKALREWGRALFARYREHSWVLDLTAPGLPTTPNHIAWVETFLKAMEGSRLSLQQKMDAALLLDGHVRNIANLIRQDKGGKIREVVATAADWLPDVLPAEKYPNYLRVLREGVLADAEGPDLNFGLNSIIAGLESQV